MEEPSRYPGVAKPLADEQYTTFYFPLYILTAVFGSIFFIGPFLVQRIEHKGIVRCCIMLTAFCMWIFWVTVYIAQMDPLVGPRLSNEVLAWVAHSWGDEPDQP